MLIPYFFPPIIMALRQPENGRLDIPESEVQYNGPEDVLSPEMQKIRDEVENELDE